MEKDKNYSRLLDEQIGLVARENRYLEFKSNYQDTDKLGRYISALSMGHVWSGKTLLTCILG